MSNVAVEKVRDGDATPSTLFERMTDLAEKVRQRAFENFESQFRRGVAHELHAQFNREVCRKFIDQLFGTARHPEFQGSARTMPRCERAKWIGRVHLREIFNSSRPILLFLCDASAKIIKVVGFERRGVIHPSLVKSGYRFIPVASLNGVERAVYIGPEGCFREREQDQQRHEHALLSV